MALVVIFLFAQPVSAAIYKWTDEGGNTHFTDDPNQIPEKYRSPSKIEKIKPVLPSAPPAVSVPRSEGKKESGKAPEWESGKALQEKTGELRNLPADEKAVFEESIAFLEQDIKRYEPFYDRPSGFTRTFIQLHRTIMDTIPEKKAAAEKLGNFENIEVFKEVVDFLNKSLAVDKKVTPMRTALRIRTIATKARIKEEAKTKTQLIEKLKTELQNRIEEAAKKKEEEAKKEEAPKKESAAGSGADEEAK